MFLLLHCQKSLKRARFVRISVTGCEIFGGEGWLDGRDGAGNFLCGFCWGLVIYSSPPTQNPPVESINFMIQNSFLRKSCIKIYPSVHPFPYQPPIQPTFPRLSYIYCINMRTFSPPNGLSYIIFTLPSPFPWPPPDRESRDFQWQKTRRGKSEKLKCMPKTRFPWYFYLYIHTPKRHRKNSRMGQYTQRKPPLKEPTPSLSSPYPKVS